MLIQVSIASVPVSSCCWERTQPKDGHKIWWMMSEREAASSWWIGCRSRSNLVMTFADKTSSEGGEVKHVVSALTQSNIGTLVLSLLEFHGWKNSTKWTNMMSMYFYLYTSCSPSSLSIRQPIHSCFWENINIGTFVAPCQSWAQNMHVPLAGRLHWIFG